MGGSGLEVLTAPKDGIVNSGGLFSVPSVNITQLAEMEKAGGAEKAKADAVGVAIGLAVAMNEEAAKPAPQPAPKAKRISFFAAVWLLLKAFFVKA